MNEAQFKAFLGVVQIILVALAAFNLSMVKKRGNRALLMSAAMLLFAISIFLYREKTGGLGVELVAAAGVGCLVADVWIHPREKRSRK